MGLNDIQVKKALKLAKRIDNFFTTPSKNLFNKNAVTSGRYVRWSDGTINTNASYSVSDWIPINGNTKYSVTRFDQTAFYDANGNYISGIDLPSNTKTYTTPPNAVYLRMTVSNTNLDSAQIEIGDVNTPYTPYQTPSLQNKLIENIDPFKTTFFDISKNLFDLSTITDGKYVDWANGTLKSNASYSVSDWIPIEPNKSYTTTKFDQTAFYDSNKNYISGIQLPSATKTWFTPPNARYMRMSLVTANKGSVQVEKGSIATVYTPYSVSLQPKYLNGMSYKSIQTITSKIVANAGLQVKFIGDSITAGVGGTGYLLDGEIIYGSYQVNTNGKCWANSLRDYLQSKYTVTVKNYGISGRNSNDLINNISSLVRSEDNIVICMIGTNDRNTAANSSKDNLYSNLVNIGNYVKGLGKEIIFMSNIPASVANETDVSNPKNYHMEDVDHVIMRASAYFNQEYISVYKEFMEYCDRKNVTIDSLLIDGIHPNDTGYDVMFSLISDKLGFGRKRPNATW